jgi:hypothetical protein
MDIINTSFSRMTFVAREYCELVDNLDDYSQQDWLARIAEVLPRLHEAVGQLHVADSPVARTTEPDIDARFDLFSRIYRKIGEREGFNPEFDAQMGGQRLSGSLADDLTDIYFDVRRGLVLLDEHPDEPGVAIHDWRHSFQLHWKHHLRDAERQLDAMQLKKPSRKQ